MSASERSLMDDCIDASIEAAEELGLWFMATSEDHTLDEKDLIEHEDLMSLCKLLRLKRC